MDKVIWQAGLLLRQHHLQCRDEQFEKQLALINRSQGPWHWGVVDLAIDEMALGQGLISIQRVSVIWPDGRMSQWTAPSKQALCLSITAADEPNLAIYLCLPLQDGLNDKCVDQCDPALALSRWQKQSVFVHDCYQDQAGQEIWMACDNLYLTTEIDSGSAKQSIQLLQVNKTKLGWQLAPYIPAMPWFNGEVLGAKQLVIIREALQQLCDKVTAVSEKQAAKTLLDDIRQTLTHYLFLENVCYVSIPSTLPAMHHRLLNLYLKIISLLEQDERYTITSDSRVKLEMLTYEHQHFLAQSRLILQQIHEALMRMLEHFMRSRIPFVYRDNHIFELPEAMLKPHSKLLVIFSGKLETSVEQSIKNLKLASNEFIEQRVNQSLPGMPLQFEQYRQCSERCHEYYFVVLGDEGEFSQTRQTICCYIPLPPQQLSVYLEEIEDA